MWKSEVLLRIIGEAAPNDCITEKRLVELTGFDARAIENSCLKLRRHGLLVKTERGCHKLLVAGRAAAKEGARLRTGPQGPRNGRVVQKGSLRARAWAAMRIKRRFSIADLAMLAVKGGERDVESNLQRYLKALALCGYVRQLPTRERGVAPTSNGFARWLLLMDTGPLPPVWRASRGKLYDPNTETDIEPAAGAPASSRRAPELAP
jgi:hypothetical protein